jgi:23S rRNA pseudouridine2605 synthase
METPEGMRLNRFLARAGRGARRSVEDDVRAGMVTVNGVVVRNPAVRVTAGDLVRFDGARVTLPDVFLAAMNKPAGVETTMDPDAPRGVHTLSRGMPPGTAPVGRLDVRTGGLLLWSNDGDLTYRLTHPRWAVEREYILLFHEPPDFRALERLRKGSFIAPGQFSRPLSVARAGGDERLRLVIATGRNREVRRLCAACGVNLSGLERIRYGPVSLKDIPRGTWRPLTRAETDGLYRAAGLDP